MSTGSRRSSFITKPATAKALLAAAALLLAAAPVHAAVADPLGTALCVENGEGTHTSRYPSGTVKIRVVCREGKRDAEVRYGWYFDERGRQVKEEDIVPDNPEMTRITESDYDLHSTEVVGTRVYNGAGKLLETTGTLKPAATPPGAKPVDRPRATYTDYMAVCRETPNDLLYHLIGAEREPQFYGRLTCGCVSQKAIRADELPLGKVWAKEKTLNPASLEDRLAVAAMQHLGECVCPQAIPGSRLEKLCTHAADVEKAWKP